MKIVPVLPLLGDESLVPVGAAPPKPVTGMAFVAEPEGAAVEAMVVGRVVFPLKGDWAPQGWSWLRECISIFCSSSWLAG